MTELVGASELQYENGDALYWIVKSSELWSSHPYHSLIGQESNNGDRWRYVTYDDEGKETVEWDSANMNSLQSSVQSVESLQIQPTALQQIARILDSLPRKNRLQILTRELMYQMNQSPVLNSQRSLKLLKALDRFDVEAALELCE